MSSNRFAFGKMLTCTKAAYNLIRGGCKAVFVYVVFIFQYFKWLKEASLGFRNTRVKVDVCVERECVYVCVYV